MEKTRKLLERKALAAATACGLGMAALTGCATAAKPEIEKGKPATVMAHDYQAGYYKIMPKIIPMYVPPKYDLELRQCDRSGDTGADAQGCVEAEVQVDQHAYDTFPDGSTIVLVK